jgi:hypothetical protein
MSRDPLSAPPRYLVEETVEVVARLELDEAAWPWLAEAGLDVGATPALLRAQAAATDVALLKKVAAKDEAGVPPIRAAAALKDVQAWQRQVRNALHRAPEDPAGKAAVRELRAALGDGRRLAAAIVETAMVPVRLRELAPALGEVPAGRLADEGEALHGRLIALRQEVDQAAGARGRQVEAAVEQAAALRATLREVRRAFQYAAEASDGQVRPLALALLKSVVATRGSEETPADGGEACGHENEGAKDEREGARDEREGAGDENKGARNEREGASDETEGARDEREGASNETEGARSCGAT